MKRYVIIGNQTAATGCIEGIRSVDKTSKITVISKEKHSAYCRPLISYYLEYKTTLPQMAYRPDDFYEKNGCEVLLGTRVTEIKPDSGEVITHNGLSLPYDELCIATGSSPFVPPMENIENVENKFSFLTMDDAIALKQAVQPDSRVLIVGAGLIGLKCAEGLRKTTCNITVCDLSDHILSSILDFSDALTVQLHLENHGIRFFLNNSIKRFEKNTAIMQDGKVVEFDILVTAVGVHANMDIFQNIGGKCTKGITVNEKMETSVKHIYSAGDCTESTDITDGKTKVMALMPNAYMQGFTAGVNMAGGSSVFDNAIPMNSIGFFGLHLMTAGTRSGKPLEFILKNSLKSLYLEGDRMVGFVLIGDVRNAGIYTNLIRNRILIDDMAKERLKDTPSTIIYDEKMRRNHLESVV